MDISGDFDGGSAAPSGRLQVLEPKDFPYLHTRKSLVFVIARNGMVWGKRLDDQSTKGDIEIEVFWPREDGCFLRIFDQKIGYPHNSVNYQREGISKEQARKIELILSRKEEIQYELGTLMVQPWATDDSNYEGGRRFPQYRRMMVKPQLDFPLGDPCKIKVIDCSYSYEWQSSENLSSWQFRYDNEAADFKFLSSIYRDGYNLEHPISSADIQNIESNLANPDCVIAKTFFAAKLSGRKFDMYDLKLHGDAKINPCLRIMYGEYDFFEYFDIDDAVLILEEETCSLHFPKLFWTLGIAQNKHVREMMRLASNNPDLFAKFFPKI